MTRQVGGPLAGVGNEVLMEAWLEAVDRLALRRIERREAEGADTRYDGGPDLIEQDDAEDVRRERLMFDELQARGLL